LAHNVVPAVTGRDAVDAAVAASPEINGHAAIFIRLCRFVVERVVAKVIFRDEPIGTVNSD
jgi:hypothetical protein